jgi:hypothetical protein
MTKETGHPMTNHKRPATVATSVLLAGVLTSLAGNVQAINLDNASPGIGAHLSAIFWPAMLFGMVELLLHTPWMDNWRDRLTKAAAILLVAGVAAWVSYWHLANVLSHYGYDVASRYAGPLAIDMGMVLATLALNRIGHARRLASGQDGYRVALATPEDRKVAEDIGATVASPPVTDKTWTDDGHGHEVADCTDTITPDVLDTDAGLFERLERDFATDNPTLPVPVSPGPAGVRQGKLDAEDSEAARAQAAAAKANGMPAGAIAEALGTAYGVSARTIRRQPWWTDTMAGRLDSDAG